MSPFLAIGQLQIYVPYPFSTQVVSLQTISNAEDSMDPKPYSWRVVPIAKKYYAFVFHATTC